MVAHWRVGLHIEVSQHCTKRNIFISSIAQKGRGCSTYACGRVNAVILSERFYPRDEQLHLSHLVDSIERVVREGQVGVGHEDVLVAVFVPQPEEKGHSVPHGAEMNIFGPEDLEYVRVDSQSHCVGLPP